MDSSLQVPGAFEAAPARAAAGAPPLRRQLVAAGFVLALALGLRLPYVHPGLLHHDEVVLADAVERSYEQRTLLPTVGGRYGAVALNLAAYAPWHAVTGGRAERVLPLVGLFAGALLVAATVLLVATLAGDLLAGVLAAAFLGTGPLFLTASAGGKENVPQLAFVTIAFWLVATGASRRSAAARWGGLALFVLSLTIHEAGVTYAPFLAAVHVAACRRSGATWRAVLVELAGFAVLLAIPLRLSIAELLLRASAPRTDAVTFLGLSSPMLPWALRHLVTIAGEAILVLAAVGLVVSALRRDLVLALAPMLLLFFYFAGTNAYTPRHLVYLVLPVAALAGAGLAAAARRVGGGAGGRARLAIPAALALAAAACAPGIVRALPRLRAHSRYLGTKAMALLVRERTEPDAIVVGIDDLPHVRYYAGRRTLRVPVGEDAAKIAFVRELSARVAGGARVYLGANYPFAYESTPLLSTLLQQTFRSVVVAPVVNEWYHAAELEDASFQDALLRLDPR